VLLLYIVSEQKHPMVLRTNFNNFKYFYISLFLARISA